MKSKPHGERDEPKEKDVARDESERTRVARLVMMLLGDGGISFHAQRDLRYDTWRFGARCTRCGEKSEKEIGSEVFEDPIDVGDVGVGLDAVVMPPKLRRAGTFLDVPIYLENEHGPSMVSSMRFASVVELFGQWISSREQPFVQPAVVPVAPTPSPARDLKSLVFEALGEASTCWSNLAGAGVFDSDRALAIGERLLAQLEGVPVKSEAPPITLAATRIGFADEFEGRTMLEHVQEHKHERGPSILVDLQDEP